MSSLRFTSFGAATVPLSKIMIDKTLDMGQYPIKLRPEEWATETLDWGDGSATDVFNESKTMTNLWRAWTAYLTPAGHGRKYTFTIRRNSGTPGYTRYVDIKIFVNNVRVLQVTEYPLPDKTGSWTHTRWIDPGAYIIVEMQYRDSGTYDNCQLVITDTGHKQLYQSEHLWSETSSGSDVTTLTATSNDEVVVTLQKVGNYASVRDVTIKVNDIVAVTYPDTVYTSYTFPPFVVNAGDVIVIHARGLGVGGGRSLVTIESTGKVVGAKTFDLAGKWLAFGLDMHGLDATVKIDGEEVPYLDYAKYFPLVPTELKIPGDWAPSQERPVIKVYKGV